MEKLEIKKVVEWCGGEINSKEFLKRFINGISTDTRKIKKGEIFVALKGENFDGHQFIKKAYEKKAAGVIISENIKIPFKNFCVIEVKDTLKALGDIAKGYRVFLNPYIIGVTGSDGKTTTKELISKCLSKKFKTSSSSGNYNNQIGLPLSIFSFDRKTEIGILEMGMNKKGEIDYLSKIARPNGCVITNIGKAHIGFFKNTKEIAESKSEIFKNLKGEKFCLLNRDDKFFYFLKSRSSGNVKSFGTKKSSDVRGIIEKEGNEFFYFNVSGEKFKINFWNTSMIYPFLVAIAFSVKFGLKISEVKDVIEEFKPIEGRGKVYKIGGITIIDESYNSNPNSLKNALLCFSRKDFKRKIVIIGDMAELGKFSNFFHTYIGKLVKKLDIDYVITFGEKSKVISEITSGKHFSDINQLNGFVGKKVKKGDGILIKGSNFLKMNRIVEFLLKN